MSSHRLPSKPPWFDDPGKGNCRWCGKPVTEKGRRTWHSECIQEYRFLFWPQVTKTIMWERSMGVCADCGSLMSHRCRLGEPYDQDGFPRLRHEFYNPLMRNAAVLLPTKKAKFHLDHIIPLADYPHDPQDPYAAWRESNLQILCEDCHKAKTAREATKRAKKKRTAERPLMEIL